ncbi:membrane protein [Anopheles sinensis]|uniref:Membrane protein n=1 Tax=Anopheles sinensis TaxID=74873 RepID=A0A084WKH9_ANOSI|nr:membrane protein [Anopheles sinensis]
MLAHNARPRHEKSLLDASRCDLESQQMSLASALLLRFITRKCCPPAPPNLPARTESVNRCVYFEQIPPGGSRNNGQRVMGFDRAAGGFQGGDERNEAVIPISVSSDSISAIKQTQMTCAYITPVPRRVAPCRTQTLHHTPTRAKCRPTFGGKSRRWAVALDHWRIV